MTEAEVKKLVEWVKAGNSPETYGSTPKTPKAKKAPGIPPEALDKTAELAEQVGFAKGRGEDPKPAQDRLNAYLTEIKAISTPPKLEVPSHPVTSPKGFALLKQKFGDFFKAVSKQDATANGNINGPSPSGDALASPKETGTSTSSGSQQFHHSQKQSKVANWFEKVGKRIVHFTWHKFVKYEHRFCKEIAKLAVPEHYTNSHHKGSSRGFFKDVTTLALTLLHWAVYWVCQFVFWWGLVMWPTSRFVPFLRPWFEWPFRFAARLLFVDCLGWLWPGALSHWGPALVAAALIWLILLARKAEPTRVWILFILLAAGWYYGRRWSEAPLSVETPTSSEVSTPSPQSTPIADVVKKIVSISKPIEKPKPASAAVITYQPSIAFNTSASPADSSFPINNRDPIAGTSRPVMTLYDAKLLEQEIAAVPKNSIVKAFPLLPDETMPGDLAVSRMQGVTDPDKYTLMIGGGKQKIISITATTTNLTIDYKSTARSAFSAAATARLIFFGKTCCTSTRTKSTFRVKTHPPFINVHSSAREQRMPLPFNAPARTT